MQGMAPKTASKTPTLPAPRGGGKESERSRGRGRERSSGERGKSQRAGSARAPRAIWSGTISFGMVSIPVRLYTATESHDVHFHLLHKRDGVRLQNVRWCPKDEKSVPWDDVVRGFEYAKGNYVPITEEDLDHLPVKTVHTVDISFFGKRSRRPGGRRSPRSRSATRRVSAWCGRTRTSSRWIPCSTPTRSDRRRTSPSIALGFRPRRSRWRSRSLRTSAIASTRSVTTMNIRRR